MTVTSITTAGSTALSTDGSDTIFVAQTGSILTTSFGNAIQIEGTRNMAIIDGLVASQTSAIEIGSTASENSISVGQTGRIVGLNSNAYSFYVRGDDNVISNHGQITGSYAVGLAGDDCVLINTGLIESIYAFGGNVAGVTMRGIGNELYNSGSIFGVIAGINNGNFSQTDSVIKNSGEIAGDIGILFNSSNGVDIDNSGIITGTGGTAINISISNANILNTGTINGDVVFGSTDAFLKNSGEILGDVFLDSSGSYFKGAVDGWVSGGVYGDIGNDTIYGASGFDYIEGGDGQDSIRGRAGDDRIFGEQGADTIRGNNGDDEIYGDQNADLIYGGRGDDTIDGGSGADTIKGGSGEDLLTGGTGTDVFVFSFRSGIDEITDFKNNTDKLDLSAFALTSRQDLTDAGAILEHGAGSIIDLTAVGGDGVIYVDDMSVAQWSASDFIF